jgi:hypothetical protein
VRDYGHVDVAELFLSMQRQMAARFATTRGFVPHDPTKGAAAEQNWLELLRAYLPERYRVDSGFVVDHRGELSEQIDVIIHDRQYSPLIFRQDGVLYVPAESVYAVFDVKQDFRGPHMRAAAAKAESVRRLKRTSVPVRFAAGTYKAKELFEITAGMLGLETWWADGVGKSLKKVLGECSQAGFLNLGCALRDGSFEARKTKRGVEVKTSTRETALIFFFLRLLDRLQKVGTVPAIDLMKYGERLAGKRVSG